MKHNYDDIIDLPHFEPKHHSRMSTIERAAQFSPFAALSGYDDAVKETARLTDEMLDLSEEEKAALDQSLHCLIENINDHPELFVTYFIPDSSKSGGSYKTLYGHLIKFNEFEKWIKVDDKIIPLRSIIALHIASGHYGTSE